MPRILYRDADLLLADKPAGLLAQANDAGGDSLPRRLEQAGAPVKPVHRLDRDTGGIMVYACSDRAAAALSRIVGQHEVFRKEYLAVVLGCPQESAGTYTDLLYHDRSRNKSYVVKRRRSGVRQASLSYQTMQTVCTPDGCTLSLIRVHLHTGRTHQIRVQFASRGMPIAGDARYGGRADCPLALWSHRLSFPHPFSEKRVEGVSEPDRTRYPWNLFTL